MVAIATIVSGVLVRALNATAWGDWLGVGLGSVGALLAIAAIRSATRPRISLAGDAVSGDTLVVARGPLRVARLRLTDVEAFFLGEGAVVLPLLGEQSVRCTNLVIRIAERAEGMQQGDVASWVGEWADGYFVIRGTWSEPLDTVLVIRLNERLANAKQTLAEVAETG
jgi:hypothetical protein